MAQKNRADLQIVIDTNLPDNTTDLITPLGHREVEEDLKDSNFNKLDDTAFNVNYPPTTPLDWDTTVPTETGGALDILIKKISTNASDSIAYVSKQGSDTLDEFELGNSEKPFLTISAAITALSTTPNASLVVLGGDYYSEEVVLNPASNDCVFDFGNCRIDRLTALFSNIETNNNIIKNVRIDNATGEVNLRATFLQKAIITNHNVGLIVDCKNVNDCEFSGPRTVATFASLDGGTEKTFTNCKITNSTSGHAIRLALNCSFIDCEIESNTGIAIDTSAASTIQNTIRLYKGTIKSNAVCISGSNADGDNTNIMAYGTKIYSSAGVPLKVGDNSNFILFQGCEFYTKLANNVIEMKANIVRAVTDTYTFKECTFNTITGFPLLEPVYGGGDLGNTLFLNCVYNAATATSIAAVKLTENNSFSYPNYTDFNNLQ